MAKYVLLTFENDADADNFVEQFQGGKVLIPTPHPKLEGQYSVVSNGALTGRGDIDGKPHDNYVRGVYKQPTQFHDSLKCAAGKQVGFTRGTKYGWMVCTKCGKPTSGWAKGDCWYTALGRNLLPVSEIAPEYRGIGVPGHFWNPDTRKWDPYIESQPSLVPSHLTIKDASGKPSEVMISTPPVGEAPNAAS